MVSKTTVTTSTPRYRRYRRRSYFYRYTWKRYRKYANRVRLNYYRAKINIHMAVFKSLMPDGVNWQYVIGGRDFQDADDGHNIYEWLRDSDEYKLYVPLFNEVKLIGISVLAVPAPNCNRTNFQDLISPFISVSYERGSAGTESLNDHLFLKTDGVSRKYWKNGNMKWCNSDQSAADQVAEETVRGTLSIDGQVSDRDLLSSPTWNLEVVCYVAFRKNKNN